MEMAPEQLVASLPSSALKSIYLVAGSERLRVLETADAIRAKAREAGCSEREIFEVQGTAATTGSNDKSASVWHEISVSLHSPSLFSAKRLIEIRLPTGKPGVEGAKLIETIALQTPSDVVVLITADEWSKKHASKWSQAIEKVGAVAVAWPIKPHELPSWLNQRLRSRKLSLSAEAISLLVDRIDGNLLAAAQEVDKLALLTKGEPMQLDAEQTRQLVADSSRFDVFRLIEATWNGQSAQAIRMLAGIKAEGAVVPALMGMVLSEIKTTSSFAKIKATGGNLAQEFRTRRVWDAKQALYHRALQRHGPMRWDRFLLEAGRIDRMSKGREVGDAFLQLERLLIAIADPKASVLLVAQRA